MITIRQIRHFGRNFEFYDGGCSTLKYRQQPLDQSSPGIQNITKV